MKKQSILCLLAIMSIFLCSCQNPSKTTFEDTKDDFYTEARNIDYKSLYNSKAILMFKSDLKDEDVGELYIKLYDKSEEKIADNVKKFQYALLNDNTVIYIDADNSLYLKKYGQEASKIDKNVDYDSIYVSSKNDICYISYEDDNFYEGEYSYYRDILLNSLGNSYVLFDSKAKNYEGYAYSYFSDDGKIVYYLNDLGLLSMIDSDGKIQKIAGNVSDLAITPDGSSFAYNSYNDRLYIKWSGAKKVYPVRSLNVYEDYQLSSNGLSCIFQSYDKDENYDLMYVSPFNEPVSICNSFDYLISRNNEYIYYCDENDDLYGCKLPKITSSTKSEDLNKQLLELEKHFIGSYANQFVISFDGKSVSYLNDKNELYTSYDLAEAVKVKDNVNNVDYISDAIVFSDNNSKLYVNEAFHNLSGIAGSNKEIADIQSYYVENDFLDNFLYVDKNSNIHTYSTKEKSKLIADNSKEYTHILKSMYTDLYFKSISTGDIKGIYSCENSSNPLDTFSIEVAENDITLVFENYYFKSDIYIDESTENYISLIDNEEYIYSFYKEDDALSLEIYDADMNSYYQYNIKNMSKSEFDKKLEQSKLEMKYNAVYSMLEDYYYNDYSSSEVLPMYAEHSLDSEIVGYTSVGAQYYVQDYYVQDDYNFWLYTEVIDDGGSYIYAWIYIDTSNIDIFE